jgi:hypothetical protein
MALRRWLRASDAMRRLGGGRPPEVPGGKAGLCPFCGGPCDAEFVDVGVGEVQVTPAECLRCGSYQGQDRLWYRGGGLAFYRRGSTRQRRSKRWRWARRKHHHYWSTLDHRKYNEYRHYLEGRLVGRGTGGW